MDLAIGDVCYLKSGGPPFTISGLSDENPEKILVMWFEGGASNHLLLPIACLTKDPPEPPPSNPIVGFGS